MPSVRTWRHCSLPKHISPDEVQRVIEVCDPATALGLRERAVIMLLAHMGLRAGEVIHLRSMTLTGRRTPDHSSREKSSGTKLAFTADRRGSPVGILAASTPEDEPISRDLPSLVSAFPSIAKLLYD